MPDLNPVGDVQPSSLPLAETKGKKSEKASPPPASQKAQQLFPKVVKPIEEEMDMSFLADFFAIAEEITPTKMEKFLQTEAQSIVQNEDDSGLLIKLGKDGVEEVLPMMIEGKLQVVEDNFCRINHGTKTIFITKEAAGHRTSQQIKESIKDWSAATKELRDYSEFSVVFISTPMKEKYVKALDVQIKSERERIAASLQPQQQEEHKAAEVVSGPTTAPEMIKMRPREQKQTDRHADEVKQDNEARPTTQKKTASQQIREDEAIMRAKDRRYEERQKRIEKQDKVHDRDVLKEQSLKEQTKSAPHHTIFRQKSIEEP